MPDLIIRSLTPSDHAWVSQVMINEWGSAIVITHNEIFHPADLPGFIASFGMESVGLITYNIAGNECEIITLNSWSEGQGVGTAFILAVQKAAVRAGCRRLFLITTNNNIHALRFYQKRSFVISAVRINAIAESRRLKPQIPFEDEDGLPIRDEIELEIFL